MIRTYKSTQKGERIGRNFTVGELWPDPSREGILLDDALVELLDRFVEHFGKKPVFSSRNAVYCLTGHASGSYHYKGMAADFSMDGVTPLELAQFAETIGAGGVGVYKDSTRHIHVDSRPSRACWWILTTGSNTPGFGGVPTVFKKGHRSPAVALIQQRLNEDGCDCGKADGVFGDKTLTALKRWQAARGLTADGAFGKLTNAAMKLFKGW